MRPKLQPYVPRLQPHVPRLQPHAMHAGELVYARVHAKGQAPGKTLREGFAPSEVLEEGLETTKNWFYKVASIRELVPRFYVELAILKCYRLLLPPAQIVANVRRNDLGHDLSLSLTPTLTLTPDPDPDPDPNLALT